MRILRLDRHLQATRKVVVANIARSKHVEGSDVNYELSVWQVLQDTTAVTGIVAAVAWTGALGTTDRFELSGPFSVQVFLDDSDRALLLVYVQSGGSVSIYEIEGQLEEGRLSGRTRSLADGLNPGYIRAILAIAKSTEGGRREIAKWTKWRSDTKSPVSFEMSIIGDSKQERRASGHGGP